MADQTYALAQDGVYAQSSEVFVDSVIPDSVTDRWQMDEGSGSTLSNSEGTVDGTLNGPTWGSESGATGGYYIQLDGTDDTWSTDSQISVSTSQATICGWIRPNSYSSFNNGVVRTADVDSNNSGWYIDTEDTAELLTASSDGTESASVLRNVSFVATGNWGFFALLLDGTDHRLITFDTSSELADQTATASYPRNYQDATLTGGIGSGYFDGDQDDFFVAQNTLLSKQEVSDIWRATNDR